MANQLQNKPPTKEHKELAERLRKILNYLQLKQSEFAEKIGVKKGTITHILNGRNFPSYQVIKGIRQKYPQINLDWFLFGKGNMITSNGNHQESLKTDELPFPEHSPKQKTSSNDPKDSSIKNDNILDKKEKKLPLPYMISPDKIIMFFEDQTFEIYTLRQKNQKI